MALIKLQLLLSSHSKKPPAQKRKKKRRSVNYQMLTAFAWAFLGPLFLSST
jgi:hypothetical protein